MAFPHSRFPVHGFGGCLHVPSGDGCRKVMGQTDDRMPVGTAAAPMNCLTQVVLTSLETWVTPR
jgi:hypothetical protein